MIRIRRLIPIIALVYGSLVSAQTADSLERIDEIQGAVNFYRYLLNTVGSQETSTRDKEVIINDSFKKIFLNAQVQVEDDLLPERSVITNKDISAYLRDVDLFFTDIHFAFEDLSIDQGRRPDQSFFYTVRFQSVIQAVTAEGDTYNQVQDRFIELNYDPVSNGLKIASIYTTKISRYRELREWWENLSYAWSRIFKSYVPHDSLTAEVLQKIAEIDSLNLDNNQFLVDLMPLTQLKELKVLSLNNTNIESFEPLRYGRSLAKLSAVNSKIVTLEPLKYIKTLTYLDVANSPMESIKGIADLNKLNYLDLSGVSASDFQELKFLKNIKQLRLSNTTFSDLALVAGNSEMEILDLSTTGVVSLESVRRMPNLKTLDISGTYVRDLTPLSGLTRLQTLGINQTMVNDLSPLLSIDGLQKVLADFSGLNEKQGQEFMSSHRRALVITNSQKVMNWWKELDSSWKRQLENYLPGSSNAPTRESLIRLLNLDTLVLSNARLTDSSPLEAFNKLKYLDISGNLFVDLRSLQDMSNLQVLLARNVPIDDLLPLRKLGALQNLEVSGTLINNLDGLERLSSLEMIVAERTQITTPKVIEFMKNNPNVTIIYRSAELLSWWEELDEYWKAVLQLDRPDSVDLHRLTQKSELKLRNSPIVSLRFLDPFLQLNELVLDNTGVTSLIDLARHESIIKLECSNGPLQHLNGIGKLTDLQKLIISNTAVSSLKPLRGNTSLVELRVSGTQIKNIKGLEAIKNLEILDISNTRVWQLHRLYDIRDLKALVCYNTRLRPQKISELKSHFPECTVTFY